MSLPEAPASPDGETVASENVRCPWVEGKSPLYVAYHDKEWGVPVHDDRLLFEFLTLEGAQTGLSWYTVLRKREDFREEFDGFDPEKVARYDQQKVEVLLQTPGIIRNRAKIEAAIGNARRFLDLQEEFGSFDAYLWRFVEGRPIIHDLRTLADYPAIAPESEALSRDLRGRGFRFVGPKVCYAHMQAVGMVNDHVLGCFRRRGIIASY